MFTLVIIVSVIGAWRGVYLWALNAFIITDQRVLDFDQKGLFHRVVSATTYNKIQDVSYSTKGIWQSTFKIGNILLQTAGNQANLELKFVANPEETVEIISKQIRNNTSDNEAPPMATQEFVGLISKMRKTIGDETVDELISKSKPQDEEDKDR